MAVSAKAAPGRSGLQELATRSGKTHDCASDGGGKLLFGQRREDDSSTPGNLNRFRPYAVGAGGNQGEPKRKTDCLRWRLAFTPPSQKQGPSRSTRTMTCRLGDPTQFPTSSRPRVGVAMSERSGARCRCVEAIQVLADAFSPCQAIKPALPRLPASQVHPMSVVGDHDVLDRQTRRSRCRRAERSLTRRTTPKPPGCVAPWL